MRCGSICLCYRMMRPDRWMIGARYETQGEITRTVGAEKFNVTSRNFRPVWFVVMKL